LRARSVKRSNIFYSTYFNSKIKVQN